MSATPLPEQAEPLSSLSSSQTVWLITGTSSGFGRVLVACLLARGERVLASARSCDKIQDLYSLPGADPSHLHLLQLDVTDRQDAINVKMEEAIRVWGQIDVVVNNAGTGLPSFLEEGGADVLMKQFEVNVFGVAKVNTAVLPYMRRRRSGTIVIIGSRGPWRPEVPGYGPYASSKAAIHAYAETLAEELKPYSLRVIIVAPGGYRTQNTEGESNIYSYPWEAPHRRPSLDERREEYIEKFKTLPKFAKGDPRKAMERVVDVVKWDDVAKGREWPMWMVLGQDAETEIVGKCETLMRTIANWRDVTSGTEVDEDESSR